MRGTGRSRSLRRLTTPAGHLAGLRLTAGSHRDFAFHARADHRV